MHAPVFRGPRGLFLWGYVKKQAFVPPLPLDIDELIDNYRSYPDN
jgi:hypothetical protein